MKKCRIEKNENQMVLIGADKIIATIGIGSEDCNTPESAQEALIDISIKHGFNRIECINFDGYINL